MTSHAPRRPARRGRLSTGHAPSNISAEESRAWAAAVAVLDRTTSDMERQWGVDRLPTLVPADLAARFARAQEQCEIAIAEGDVELAAQKAAALARGWQALDAAARAAGHAPGDTGKVWFAEMQGVSYAVCLHTTDCAALAARYPDHQAVSVHELLRLLVATETGRLVAAVKDQFPGAALTGVVPASTRPPIDWARGDELPI